MSRSYKKHPYNKCLSTWAKRQANRAVRRNKDLINGKMYRRCYDTWAVIDYVSYSDFNYYCSTTKRLLALYSQYFPWESKWVQEYNLDNDQLYVKWFKEYKRK